MSTKVAAEVRSIFFLPLDKADLAHIVSPGNSFRKIQFTSETLGDPAVGFLLPLYFWCSWYHARDSLVSAFTRNNCRRSKENYKNKSE